MTKESPNRFGEVASHLIVTKGNKMKIAITAFGIAKDILQQKQIELECSDSSSVGDVRDQLIQNFPEFEKLASLKFAVNTEYVADDYQLNANDEVVLIPPVSGG